MTNKKRTIFVFPIFCFIILQSTTFILTPYSKDFLYRHLDDKTEIIGIILTTVLISLLVLVIYLLLFNIYFTNYSFEKKQIKPLIPIYIISLVGYLFFKYHIYSVNINYFALSWIIDNIYLIFVQISLTSVLKKHLIPKETDKKRTVLLVSLTVFNFVSVLLILIQLKNRIITLHGLNVSPQLISSTIFKYRAVVLLLTISIQYLYFLFLTVFYSADKYKKPKAFFLLLCLSFITCSLKTVFPIGMIAKTKVYSDHCTKISDDEIYVDTSTIVIYRYSNNKNKEIDFAYQKLKIYYGNDLIYTIKNNYITEEKCINYYNTNKTKGIEIKDNVRISIDNTNGDIDFEELYV